MDIHSFDLAKQYAFGRLERELSPKLVYHGLRHTRDEVVPWAEKLGPMEGLSAEGMDLLRTAAWFHDIGFVEGPANHELVSIRIAMEVLPGFRYTPGQIEVIRGAILATILPQAAITPVEKILADADLSVLGSPNFLPRSSDLRRERATYGHASTDVEWCQGQLKFLQDHDYFTHSAHALLNAQKDANIAALQQELISLAS